MVPFVCSGVLETYGDATWCPTVLHGREPAQSVDIKGQGSGGTLYIGGTQTNGVAPLYYTRKCPFSRTT